MSKYAYTPASVLDGAKDAEFTREEWLAWREQEFAGYDPEGLVWDEEGGIDVTPYQLAQDESTLRELRRVWLNTELVSADGTVTIRGANPFSTDEGAAEWLHRARIELRFLYREARDDRERSAIVAREAALRARHNARCYARRIAAYFGLVEAEVLSVLDRRQKDEPIGWLGLEAAMRKIHASLFDDYQARLSDWNGEFQFIGSDAPREQKDEWLDRMPVPPEHPSHLVSSVKKLRPFAKVVRETAAADVREHQAQPMPVREGVEVEVGSGLTPGQRRLFAREAQRPGWWDARREWELAEGITPERLDVPESLDFSSEVGGDLGPVVIRHAPGALHRCGSSCLVCSALAA